MSAWKSNLFDAAAEPIGLKPMVVQFQHKSKSWLSQPCLSQIVKAILPKVDSLI